LLLHFCPISLGHPRASGYCSQGERLLFGRDTRNLRRCFRRFVGRNRKSRSREVRCVHPGPFRDRGRRNYPEAVPKERSGGNGRWIAASNWLPGGPGQRLAGCGAITPGGRTGRKCGGRGRLAPASYRLGGGAVHKGDSLLGQFEREGIGNGRARPWIGHAEFREGEAVRRPRAQRIDGRVVVPKHLLPGQWKAVRPAPI